MSDWEPEEYADDPKVNAMLNIAAGIFALARATDGLLYALKYSKGEGMSVAEAIEVGAKNIAEAIQLSDPEPVEPVDVDPIVEAISDMKIELSTELSRLSAELSEAISKSSDER